MEEMLGDLREPVVRLLNLHSRSRSGSFSSPRLGRDHRLPRCTGSNRYRLDLVKAHNGLMPTVFWIVIIVLAIGGIAGGLLRMQAWLRKPAPPEVIEAARREREAEDD